MTDASGLPLRFGEPDIVSRRVLPKIRDFIADLDDDSRPCLLHDLGKLRWNVAALRSYLGDDVPLFYSMKANADGEVLRALARLDCGFQAAARGDVELLLDLGVDPERIVFGNPCLAPRDADRLYRLGVRHFTVETLEMTETLARLAPEARLFLRINLSEAADVHVDYGATLRYVRQVVAPAERRQRRISGLSFHGLHALGLALCGHLIETEFPWIDTVNLGGSFLYPELRSELCEERVYGGFGTIAQEIRDFARRYGVALMAEPGRALVDSAVHAFAHVIYRSTGCHRGPAIHLDIGPTTGLRTTVRGVYANTRPNVVAASGILADFTGSKREIGRLSPCPLFEVGDVLAIPNIGSYSTIYITHQTPALAPARTYWDDGSRPPDRAVRAQTTIR